jgi:hypothetical protein
MTYKIGIVGLGVMGHNLALNMEHNGFPVAGYGLDATKTKTFLEGSSAGKNIAGVDSPESLMTVLEKPRRILLMVPAGSQWTAPLPISSRTSNPATYYWTGAIPFSWIRNAATKRSRLKDLTFAPHPDFIHTG